MNEIKTPQEILDTKHLSRAERKKYFKDGIEIEKGAIITEKRIERYRELYEQYCHYWSVYPDKFVDTITPTNSKFSLKFFQRKKAAVPTEQPLFSYKYRYNRRASKIPSMPQQIPL